MLNYLRASCAMLRDGVTTRYIVTDLAQHLGTTMQAADQVLDIAQEADCPGLTIGPNGAVVH